MQTLDNGPVVLREFFNSEVHSQIKSYVSSNSKYFPGNVDQEFVRTYLHNNSFFSSIHHQLTDVASEVFGEIVKPSYVYLSMYKDGGRCPLHLDRNPCRFTIDYLISQEQEEEWPICISRPINDVEREVALEFNNAAPENEQDLKQVLEKNEWDTVLLKENDAVCYTGTHSWHYRPTAVSGFANLVFFHYVPLNYQGSLS